MDRESITSAFASADTSAEDGLEEFVNAVAALNVLTQKELVTIVVGKDFLASIKSCCLARHLAVRCATVKNVLPVILFKVWSVVDLGSLELESFLIQNNFSGDLESENDYKLLKETLKDCITECIKILCLHITAASIEQYPPCQSDAMNNINTVYDSNDSDTRIYGNLLFESCCEVLYELLSRYNYAYRNTNTSIDHYIYELLANNTHVCNWLHLSMNEGNIIQSSHLNKYIEYNQQTVIYSSFIRTMMSILSVDLLLLQNKCNIQISTITNSFFVQLLLCYTNNDHTFNNKEISNCCLTEFLDLVMSELVPLNCIQNLRLNMEPAQLYLNSQQFNMKLSSTSDTQAANTYPLVSYWLQLVFPCCKSIIMKLNSIRNVYDTTELLECIRYIYDYLHITSGNGISIDSDLVGLSTIRKQVCMCI